MLLIGWVEKQSKSALVNARFFYTCGIVFKPAKNFNKKSASQGANNKYWHPIFLITIYSVKRRNHNLQTLKTNSMSRQNYYRKGSRSSTNSSGYGRPGYASYDYNDGYNGSHRQSRRNYGSGGGNYGDRDSNRNSNRNYYDEPNNYRTNERTRDNWNNRTDRDRDRENYFSSDRNRGNYSNDYNREKNYSTTNYSTGRNNDNFLKRTGRKIKNTWNDWTRNDRENYDRNNGYYRERRNFNEYSPENEGYQGRNANDYRSSRYSDHDYYNPSENYRERRTNDYSTSGYGGRNRNYDHDYGYYESYPRYESSSRYANQHVRPYKNNRSDDYYNGQSWTEGTNAYTPISEY
jgi:hypothetical protein